jgi:hypothetical protein
MNYFEVSAMEGRNVDDMMHSMITQVYETKIKPNRLQHMNEY